MVAAHSLRPVCSTSDYTTGCGVWGAKASAVWPLSAVCQRRGLPGPRDTRRGGAGPKYVAAGSAGVLVGRWPAPLQDRSAEFRSVGRWRSAGFEGRLDTTPTHSPCTPRHGWGKCILGPYPQYCAKFLFHFLVPHIFVPGARGQGTVVSFSTCFKDMISPKPIDLHAPDPPKRCKKCQTSPSQLDAGVG